MAWHGMALMLLAGCAPSTSPVDPEVEKLVRSLQSSEGQLTESEYAHDFGPVLAHGQTLKHEFALRNTTDRPLRILGAEALTPCCSAIEALPASILAGGEIAVPVIFKPGFQSGRRQVQFAIKTDDTSQAVRLFSLVASLLAEVEIELLPDSDISLLVGHSGRQTLRVTCRRVGDEGRGAPERVLASSGLSTRFLGPAVEETKLDGLIESTRELEVCLPAENDVSTRLSSLILRWSGGGDYEHRLSWRVKPCVEAVPSALVIHDSDAKVTRTVQLLSRDTPFRIVRVTGPFLEQSIFSKESGLKHRVTLALSGSQADGERAGDLVIETDHPTQPLVVVSLLAVSSRENEQ